MSNPDMREQRARIDLIDKLIVTLLNKRAALIAQLPRMKHQAGLPMLDENREREVLVRVAKHNSGPFSQESIVRIFFTIIRECRNLQRPEFEKLGTSKIAIADPSTEATP